MLGASILDKVAAASRVVGSVIVLCSIDVGLTTEGGVSCGGRQGGDGETALCGAQEIDILRRRQQRQTDTGHCGCAHAGVAADRTKMRLLCLRRPQT